jgi:hypothetical protein
MRSSIVRIHDDRVLFGGTTRASCASSLDDKRIEMSLSLMLLSSSLGLPALL